MTRNGQTLLGGIGVLAVVSGATLAAGLPGLLAGSLFAVLWYRLPVAYAFTFGQLIIVALVAEAPTPAFVLVCESGLLAVLVAPTLSLDQPRFRAFTTAGCAIVLASGVWLLARWHGSVWLPALALTCCLALGSYGLHRYDRVLRGVVEVN